MTVDPFCYAVTDDLVTVIDLVTVELSLRRQDIVVTPS